MTYVTNPLTGRPVAIGSTVYKRLVKQGLIEDNTVEKRQVIPSRMPPQRHAPLVVKKPKSNYMSSETTSDSDGTMNQIRKITEKTIEKMRIAGASDDDEFDEDDIELIKNIVIKKYNNKNQKQ